MPFSPINSQSPSPCPNHEVVLPKHRTTREERVSEAARELRDDMMRDLSRLLGQQEFGSLDDVNAFLQKEVMGKPLPHVQPTNNRERAEDMVMHARRERSIPKMRAQVAKALVIDADCVAAHLLLAEVADSPTRALAHCRDSIAAGDRVLADLLAQEGAPIWQDSVGRPYLMARHVYAQLLWQIGDRPLAIDEARITLRLNPNDNQGLRYMMLDWLMRAGSVADINALLASYDDGSAAWLFTVALHRYRTLGPVVEATKALRAAMKANVHVAPMLLGTTPIPDGLPDTYGLGDVDEAAFYVHESSTPWYEAVGAMEWLGRIAPAPPAAKRGRRPSN